MSEKDEKNEKNATGRMRAFAGNSCDDYYDHALSEHPLPGRLLIGVVVRILWVITKFLWPWKIEHAERLLSDSRGRVLIMNHESMLDPVVIVVTMWLAHVPVRIVYKGDFDRIKPAAWLFSRAGGFPVARGTADMKTVRRARTMLVRGENVLIYPVGTRFRRDEDEKPHGGYAIMAQLAKAPVQPIAIIGARHLRFRRPVYMDVAEPIEWAEISSDTRKEQLAEMESIGMARVYALRNELRERSPGVD